MCFTFKKRKKEKKQSPPVSNLIEFLASKLHEFFSSIAMFVFTADKPAATVPCSHMSSINAKRN